MPEPSQLAYMASLGFACLPPQEVVRTLKSLGYAAVEWTMAHFDPRTHSAAQIAELVAATQGQGLAVSEVVVQQDLVSLDAATRRDRCGHVQECIEAAGRAGIGTLNLFSGPAPWDPSAPTLGRDISEGEAWDQVLAAFAEFVPLAESAGVRLAVEAVFGMVVRDYYTTLPLLHAFDSPALGLNYDPSHYQLYRNDIPWTLRQWGRQRIFPRAPEGLRRCARRAPGGDLHVPAAGGGCCRLGRLSRRPGRDRLHGLPERRVRGVHVLQPRAGGRPGGGGAPVHGAVSGSVGPAAGLIRPGDLQERRPRGRT